jgi:hypothetical protein
MSYGRNAYIGNSEVTDLIGQWQQIVGAQPWHQIVGAEVAPQYQWNPYTRQWQLGTPAAAHPHHHRRWGRNQQQCAPYTPYANYGHGGYGQPATVRDHRRAGLYQSYVQGDTIAGSALALMGAEDAQAAATGVPPADATIPAPPLPPAAAAANAAAVATTSPAAMPPPPPVPMPMPPMPPPDMMTAPPPPPPEMHHHRHHHHHRGGGNGGPPPGYGWEIGPRNAMIDYNGPSRADRVILPMSSGSNILPNTSVQVTARPQNVAFRPERIVIGGEPANWIINDVKVGNRSQFSQSGDVPGELFAATTIDSFVSFETVQTAMDFVILTTFVGTSESGSPFICGVLGTAAI